MKYPKHVQEEIREAELIGAYCVTLSYEADKRGDLKVGEYWDKKAVEHYDRAEKIKSDYAIDREEQLRGSVR